MELQVHAKRYAADEKERQMTFNSQPASVCIDEGEEVVIAAKDGIVKITIGGKPQGTVGLGEWEYTAVAIAYTS